MRGGAVVILAALVGAWALGLAEAGDNEKSPPPNVVKPIDPDDSPLYDIQRSSVVKKSDAPRTRQPDPSDARSSSRSRTPPTRPRRTAATGPDPRRARTRRPPLPTRRRTPRIRPTPQPPTNPPGEPEQECTDLVSVLNCVLDPITGQP